MSIAQLETTNLDRQYFYRKSSKFATEHLALEIIYSFFELFSRLFLLDSILCQRLLFQRQLNKLPSVFNGSVLVCPVIDHEFRHYIVKVAVDRRVDPQTTLTM